MSTPLPSLDTIKHLLERLKANDVAWFQERFKAGDLAWLKDRLPDGGYEKLGERIEAGDLGWLRERLPNLPGMNLPGLDFASFGLGKAGAAVGAVTGAVGSAGTALKGATVGAAGAGAAAAMSAGRKRYLWLLPVALLAVIIASLGLKNCGNDDDVVVDETEEVVDETVADETEGVATDAATETVAADTVAADTVAVVAATEAAAPDTVAPVAPAAPAGDIVAVASSAGSFTKLTAAVGAAGLAETLQGPGPLTVFAPNDAAFDKLPAGVLDALLKPENKDTLAKILAYHVVAGKVMAADVTTGKVASLQSSELDLVAADGKVTVNGANVISADIAATNGVIHVIDQVLVPSGIDVASLLAPAAPETNAAGDATPEGLTVYFGNGSAAIGADGQAKIDNAAAVLAALPAGTKVSVVGHASATGNAAANQKLSENRAANVVAALKAKMGDKAGNVAFTSTAKGDGEPVADEAKSRRVTVEIQK